jgi:TolB-like protein
MSFKMFSKGCCFLLLTLVFSCAVIYAEPNPYKQMAREFSQVADRLTNPKIAVLPFSYIDKRISNGGDIISERLTTQMVKMGKFKVIEREFLQNVLKELHLEATGVVDVATTKELGKVLGVDAILTGSLIDNGDRAVEANARIIKTDTAEVIATSSVKITRDWSEVGDTQPHGQSEYPSQQQPASGYQSSEAAVSSQQTYSGRKWNRKIKTYFDVLFGIGSSAKMDLTFQNNTYGFSEQDLGIDINGSGSVDTARVYNNIKFTGMDLNANSMPLGMRFVGFGDNWGGAFEMSYYSYNIAKQATTFSYNGGQSQTFNFFVDDYIRINTFNLLSGDIMFRFTQGMIQPYIGLGLGMTLNNISSPYIYGNTSGVYAPPMTQTEIGLLTRIPIGLRVDFGDNGSAFVEYRPTTNYFIFDRAVSGDSDIVSMSYNFLFCGLGYKF